MRITFALYWGNGGEWTVIVGVELSTTSVYLRLNTILSNTSWTLSSYIVYHISADLWSASSVVIRCHPCLSITPILIDKILWWCIACPFKGYCQQMLGINTVLICHKPQENHGKQGSMKGLWIGQRENSRGTVSPWCPYLTENLLWSSTICWGFGPYNIVGLGTRPWVQHDLWGPFVMGAKVKRG